MIYIRAQLTRRSGASIEPPLYRFFRASKTWELASCTARGGDVTMIVERQDSEATTELDCAKLETSFRRMCARHGMDAHSFNIHLADPEPEAPAEELGRYAYLPHGFGR